MADNSRSGAHGDQQENDSYAYVRWCDPPGGYLVPGRLRPQYQGADLRRKLPGMAFEPRRVDPGRRDSDQLPGLLRHEGVEEHPDRVCMVGGYGNRTNNMDSAWSIAPRCPTTLFARGATASRTTRIRRKHAAESTNEAILAGSALAGGGNAPKGRSTPGICAPYADNQSFIGHHAYEDGGRSTVTV